MLEESAALAHDLGTLAEQALCANRAGGGPQELIGSALRTIGLGAFRCGDEERAAAVHLERLALYRGLGIRGSVAACLEISPTSPLPATDRSRQLIFSLRRTLCAARTERRFPAPSVIFTTGGWLRCGRVLGDQDFAVAWTGGQAMTLDSALNEAKVVGAPWHGVNAHGGSNNE